VRIRRIVVGLDLAPQSRATLATAAALAGALDAELEALFVESDELHRLAALPFARELGLATAAPRPMSAHTLQRSLEGQIRDLRRTLSQLSGPRAARWTFRVTRGSVAAQLHAQAGKCDLTVAGVPRWGPEALSLARGMPATLVVFPAGPATRGPVVAIVPTAVAPERAAAVLGPIAKQVGGGLTILVLAASIEAAGRWCETAATLLEQGKLPAHLEVVRENQPEALERALARLWPRAVVIVAAAAVDEHPAASVA
jgi:hypothetical protein